MHDIVLSTDLAKARGIGKVALASTLPNFKSCKEQKEARAFCKQKGAMLHFPSYEPDDGALVELSHSGGALVFSFSDILQEQGFRRAILISKMRLCLAACRRYKAGFVFCTLAGSQNEVRNSREIDAFSVVVGIKPEERKASERLLARLCEGAKNEAH